MALKRLAAQNYRSTSRRYSNGYLSPEQTIVQNASFILKCTDSNTFTDASPNAFTIGNYGSSVTTSTSATKFAGKASAYFAGGSTRYLYVADDTKTRPGSGNFTIAFWCLSTSWSGFVTPFGKGFTQTGAILAQTGGSDSTPRIYASGAAIITSSSALTTNTWQHVALVRNNGTMTLYFDGVSVGSASNTTDFNYAASFGIGNCAPGDTYGFVGYMQDFFLSKTAVWTSNFTPPGSLT